MHYLNFTCGFATGVWEFVIRLFERTTEKLMGLVSGWYEELSRR